MPRLRARSAWVLQGFCSLRLPFWEKNGGSTERGLLLCGFFQGDIARRGDFRAHEIAKKKPPNEAEPPHEPEHDASIDDPAPGLWQRTDPPDQENDGYHEHPAHRHLASGRVKKAHAKGKRENDPERPGILPEIDRPGHDPRRKPQLEATVAFQVGIRGEPGDVDPLLSRSSSGPASTVRARAAPVAKSRVRAVATPRRCPRRPLVFPPTGAFSAATLAASHGLSTCPKGASTAMLTEAEDAGWTTQ